MAITAAQRAAAQRDIEAVRNNRKPTAKDTKAKAVKPEVVQAVQAQTEAVLAQVEAESSATVVAQPQAEVRPVVEVLKPEPSRIEAAKEVVQESIESVAARATAAVDELLQALGACSPKRYLVAIVLSLTAACGVGYLIGQVIAWCMGAVLLATGSGFLATLVLVLGVIIAFFAGKKVGGMVMEYIVCRHADAHWAKVKGFFTSSKAPVVAPAAA